MTTIRRQLTWKLLVAFAMPLILGGAIAFALIRDEMIEQFDTALEAQATAVAEVTRISARWHGGRRGLLARGARFRRARPLGERENDETPPAFQIRRLDGSSVVRSPSLGSADLPTPVAPRDDPRFWNVGLPSGRRRPRHCASRFGRTRRVPRRLAGEPDARARRGR